jgi:hypothetical protein
VFQRLQWFERRGRTAYGPPGTAWDRLGPDKFFSPDLPVGHLSGRGPSGNDDEEGDDMRSKVGISGSLSGIKWD